MKKFVLEEENAVYAKRLNALVEAELVKVPALDVIEGGLAMVEDALKRLKSSNRGGRKLVVSVA